MHNPHFCVIAADSAEEAEAAVEAELQDWGDENNWRSICGSVSEHDEVHVTGDGRYPPDDNDNTIAKLNRFMQSVVDGQDCPIESEAMAAMKLVVEGGVPETARGWWCIKQYAERMFNMQGNGGGRFAKGGKFDILTSQFMDGCYDEIGVTNFVDPGPRDGEDAIAMREANPLRKRYVVFVDMHS